MVGPSAPAGGPSSPSPVAGPALLSEASWAEDVHLRGPGLGDSVPSPTRSARRIPCVCGPVFGLVSVAPGPRAHKECGPLLVKSPAPDQGGGTPRRGQARIGVAREAASPGSEGPRPPLRCPLPSHAAGLHGVSVTHGCHL